MPLAVAPPTVRLHTFEGPLDLLLHLVRAGRMDIFDLPIVTLCDQYLAHLRSMEALDLAIAGEFFVMAATLLEIKSRLLLPAPPREEDLDPEDAEADPRNELVRRLLEYSRYQAISDALRDREGERQRLFFREPTPYSPEFAQPAKFGQMSAEALLKALQKVLAELGAGEAQVTSVRRQKVTLRMTMRLVLNRAREAGAGGLALEALFPEPPFERLEIVLLFLSLLELLRTGAILVEQESFCGALRVTFVPEELRPSEETPQLPLGEEGDDDA